MTNKYCILGLGYCDCEERSDEYEYESNLFTIYSRRVTIEADITLVFLFHNEAEQP
jgi:hypothetical protein